ncbi:dentin sialophosphoprotein-like [Planococcus citri]|uniref:dentin sialophosphoprotein-like n=1 Tax=Planococcus citri TaxID=170843 RepID=UPI0031F8D77B
MKLSTVFELLLIFLIIAFAASKYIDPKGGTKWKSQLEKSTDKDHQRKERQNTPNRHCSCSNLTCNCCRDFSLPVVPVKGPGCATLKYVQGDSMLVTMSFGDRVLRNVTISGKKPRPICMGLPGGISKFCGRIYGISRDGDQIRACLGLELRALDDVEAALRVSCFKFGPKGINVEPGKPVPSDEDDEDDDDDDDFDLPGDDDDDDDDDDDEDDDVFGLEDDDENESENTVESGETDYTGFSALSDDFLDSFFESDSPNKKKKNNVNAVPINYKPQQIITSKPFPTTSAPAKKAKPQRVVTTKLVLSTPSKLLGLASTEKPISASSLSSDKVYVSPPSDKLYQSSSEKHSTTSDQVVMIPDSEKLASTMDKVYISPSQYKPTERIRPQTIKQSLQSYIPTVPQQITTDKIYPSSLSQQQTTENNYLSTMDDKEQHTISNYYVPTTQQFQSTEKVYIPVNLSTPDGDFEPVTSTSVSVSVMQGDSSKISNSSNDNMVQVATIESSATESTPDNEYNEVDSDTKTTINDRIMEVNTVSSTLGLKINRPTTKAPAKDDDDDEFEDVVDSVFDVDDESSTKKNDSSSEELDLDDDLDDSDEDLDESSSSNIVLANNENSSNNDYANDDDDDDDEEFRKFDLHSKQTIRVSSTASAAQAHPLRSSARTHKRMNLPPLFNIKPEVSSFLSSGGHLYKIRMSPIQETQNTPPRLGRLNLPLALPESDSKANPLNIFNAYPSLGNVPSSSSQQDHRFGIEREQEQRSSRNHKRMRLPPVDDSNDGNSH